MKLLIRIAINTAIGIVLVFVWLHFVNLGQIIQTLKTVKLNYVTLFFGFFILSTCFRALRLKILLEGYRIPLLRLIFLNFLSQFLSFTIPIRAGEITKSVYLSTQLSQPIAKTLIWVLIDRFLDFWINILLLSLLILIVPINIGSQFRVIIFAALIIFSLLTMIMINSSIFSKQLISFTSHFFIFKRVKKIFLSLAEAILEGFSILKRTPQELALLLFVSALAAISDSLIWFFVFLSFGVKISSLKLLLGSLFSALTFLIPAAPGYIGSAEASGLAVFSGILGLDPNIASAAAVLAHILTILALPIFGIISLYLLKFDLKLVWKKLTKK